MVQSTQRTVNIFTLVHTLQTHFISYALLFAPRLFLSRIPKWNLHFRIFCDNLNESIGMSDFPTNYESVKFANIQRNKCGLQSIVERQGSIWWIEIEENEWISGKKQIALCSRVDHFVAREGKTRNVASYWGDLRQGVCVRCIIPFIQGAKETVFYEKKFLERNWRNWRLSLWTRPTLICGWCVLLSISSTSFFRCFRWQYNARVCVCNASCNGVWRDALMNAMMERFRCERVCLCFYLQ